MNATTTYLPVTVGNGKAVHLGADRGDGYGPSVDCGAVRYRNITTRSITRQPAGTEATCTKCLKAAAARAEEQAPAEVAAAPKRVSAAAAVRDEITAVVAEAPAARYYASRADGRYRVIDGAIIDAAPDGLTPGAAYVSTHASRAKAEERAAQLNAAEAVSPASSLVDVNGHLPEFAEPMTEEEAEEVAVAILGPARPAAEPVAEQVAEKAKAVRFHGRVHTLLLGPLAVLDGPAAPVLSRLAAAKTLTDGGRSIPTTAADRDALRALVADRLTTEEAAAEPTLTVTDRNSLHAFLRSAWMTA
jgi:hypothetical protein